MTNTHLTRRTVIQGGSVVGGTMVAGGLLAACGGDDAPQSPAPTTEAPADPTDEAPTEGGGGAPQGTELGPTSEVPVGGGTIFTGDNVLVAQPNEGEFVAFSSVCTHQGCAVSMVEGTTMTCPCHGSEFSTDDGSVLQGPASDPLPSREIQVDGDTIYLV